MSVQISTKEELLAAVASIAEKVEGMVMKTIGRQLSIVYVTIFTHRAAAYDRLVELGSNLGKRTDANNGEAFILYEPFSTAGGKVGKIRIRKPDPYRSQLGCADLKVEDYVSFKEHELARHPQNLRLIVRPEYEMIEFFDMDSNDVLAYVLSR